MRSLVLASVSALALACVSTNQSSPAGARGAVLTHAAPVSAWWIVQGGERVGSVVRYEPAGRPDRGFFAVRNEHGQDLGLVDALGRSFRHRPHRPQPEWVGTGTVQEGAARILESSLPVELDPVPIEALPNAADPVPTGLSPAPIDERD